MKIMPLILILFFAVAAFSQVSSKSGATVNGIGLGSTREQVIGKLGKPLSEAKQDAGECVGGTEMTLKYPGLEVKLWEDVNDPKKFTVGFLEVTSGPWTVAGVKLGQTDNQIRRRFGRPNSQATDDETKLPVWYYEMDLEKGPGTTNFEFRNGKVVRIISLWMMC